MARVVSLHWLNESVFELELEREGLEYRVGDCTLLIHDDQVTSRPYSFSSHPDQENLTFLIRSLTGGFSHWLSRRVPGDRVDVGTPFGWFRPGRSDREVYFATGTGIAPFLSALRARRPVRPRVLFFGVRSPQEAVFRPFLESRADVVWAFSRSGEPSCPRRRITDVVDRIPLSSDLEYYLCGQNGMIETIQGWLAQRSIPSNRIHQEAFFQ